MDAGHVQQSLASIGRFIADFASQFGVFGLALGMFAESLGIPFGGAVLELTAGPLIVAGKTTYLEAIAFATVGLTLGSVVSYYMGYYGADLRGRALGKAVDSAEAHQSRMTGFLNKYGDQAILLAQLFGPFRTWISIPAGAMKMDIRKFILYTAIGGALYCSFAIGLSVIVVAALKALYFRLLGFLHPYANIAILASIVGLLVLLYFLVIHRIVARKLVDASMRETG